MAADAIAQTKMGTEALVLCVAGALCERDPSLLPVLRERIETLYQILDDRGDHEAAAMLSALGRALIDPEYRPPSQ